MPAGSVCADGGVGVDQDLDVQAVVAQQHRPRGRSELTGVAEELFGCREAGGLPVTQRDEQLSVVDLDAGRVTPCTGGQRGSAVKKAAGIRDDLVAADLVVTGALLGAVVLGNHVGAVQRVVQRAPPGVRGIQREPRVEDRDHELGTRRRGDLVVDARGRDGEVIGLGQQIADLGEELLVRLGIDRLDHPLAMPLVDAGLQIVSPCQQVLVLRRQIGDDLVNARPEGVGVEAGTRQRLVVDEVVQHLGHTQVAHFHAIGHISSLA